MAKIDIDGRRLIIREIPAMTTTEKLIDSVEKAVNKNKLKIASINDYTGENVEIEIVPARGYKTEKTLKILYAYTECSVSVSSSRAEKRLTNMKRSLSSRKILRLSIPRMITC